MTGPGTEGEQSRTGPETLPTLIVGTSTSASPGHLSQLAIKGVAWSAAQALGSRLLTIVTFIALAHLLGPRSFGIVAFASVGIAFLNTFVALGLAQAIVQLPTLEKRHLDTAFWVSNGLGFLLAAAVVASSWPLARLFHVPEAAPVLQVLALGFPLTALGSCPTAILQRRMAFRSLAIRFTLGSLVGAVVGIGLALLGAGVWSLVAQTLCTSATGLVVVWTAARWRPGLAADRASFSELFRFSRNVVGMGVAWFVLGRTDDFFIGAFLGPALLGIYSVAYRLLVVLMDITISTVEAVALPTFSRLQSDIPRLRRAYSSATRISAVVALPVFFFLLAAAPEVIHVFFGAKWDRSIPVMRVLSVVGVANTLTNFNATLLMSLGQPGRALRFMTIASVANIVAVAIAVHWGIVAVATAVALRTCFVGSPLSIKYVKAALAFTLPEYFVSYVTPLLASIPLIGLVLVEHAVLNQCAGNTIRLFVMAASGALAYLAAIRLLDQGLFDEVRTYLRSMVSRQLTVTTERR